MHMLSGTNMSGSNDDRSVGRLGRWFRNFVPRVLLLLAVSLVLLVVTFGFEIFLGYRTFDGYMIWPARVNDTVMPSSDIMPGVSDMGQFTTNKYGLRAPDFSWRDKYRILAVGGSTTECSFLDDSETWPHLLGRELEKKSRFTRIWLGNAGKSGHSTENHVEFMNLLVPQLPDIDAVLFLVGINDMSFRLSHGITGRHPKSRQKNKGKTRKPTFFQKPSTQDPLYKFPGTKKRLDVLRQRVCGCSQQPKRRAFDLDAKGEAYMVWRHHRQYSPNRIARVPNITGALERYRQNLNKIIDSGRDQGLRMIFATQPTIWHAEMSPYLKSLLWFGGVGRFQEEPNHSYYTVEALAAVMYSFNQALMEVCESREVEFVDLAAVIPMDTTVFYDDCHFNENGARLVAGVLAEWLIESPPLTARDRN